MCGDAFIHFVSGSRRVNIRLGVLLLIPKSPHMHFLCPENKIRVKKKQTKEETCKNVLLKFVFIFYTQIRSQVSM